jgi:serine/threonine protein kinase
MHQAPGTFVTPDVRLVAPLSQGAMGTLWVAEHLGLGTRVVVKFVAHKLAGDAAALARFRREAKAAAQLRSQHVVRTMDYGTMDGGAPYIVMELLEGETLGARLRRTRSLGLRPTALLVSHVAEALGEAHALGIVHRDIKADNIFLAHSPEGLLAKVLDFGMAKHHASRAGSLVTATGVIVGTPEYMSPEQVLGSKHVDHRADLWALGVVTYRALFGRMPFTGGTPHALVFNICKGAHRKPSELGLPTALDAWFARALAPQVELRFASAQELCDAFAAAAATTERLGFGTRNLGELSSEGGAEGGNGDPASVRAPPSREPRPEIELAGPESHGVVDDGAMAATVAVRGLGDRLLDGDTLERVAAPPAREPDSVTAERPWPRPSAPGPMPSAPGSSPPPPAVPSARGSFPSVPPSGSASSAGSAAAAVSTGATRRSGRRTWLGVLGAAVAVAVAGSAVLLGGSTEREWSGATAMTPRSADGRPVAPPTPSVRAAASAAHPDAPTASAAGAASGDAGLERIGPGIASGHGSLSLVCEPRCEQVLVDDWTRGPSPIAGLELDPGDHRVTLKRGDRAPKVVRVTIVAGEETRRVVSMGAAPDAGAMPGASGSAAEPAPAPPSSGGADVAKPDDR